MLKMCATYLRHLLGNKKGQGMVEYGLIIGLVAVAVIILLSQMGEEIGRVFESIKTELEGVAA